MTKLVTSIAALQLAERGLLAPDEPRTFILTTWRSSARLIMVSMQVAKGNLKTQTRLTARELITHTAGFVYEIWDANAQQAVTTGLTESFLAGGNFLVNPLAFQPGTQWEYGTNTDWLGILIEQRSGR